MSASADRPPQVPGPLDHSMSQLFFPKPAQWGLRGDPVLWHELVRRGRMVALPHTIDEVEKLLVGMIEDVLEQDWRTLRRQEHLHRPELDRGGMSGGHVSITTWRARLIPLLLARAKALHDYSWSSEFWWAREP